MKTDGFATELRPLKNYTQKIWQHWCTYRTDLISFECHVFTILDNLLLGHFLRERLTAIYI